MGLPLLVTASFVSLSALLQPVHAWDAAGHETVATIAQVYLHATVLPTICQLLGVEVTPAMTPAEMRTRCHLASVATWADRERGNMKWSAPMHYVGAIADHPRPVCQFPGPQGWDGIKSRNILDATKNVTRILAEWSGIIEAEDARYFSSLPIDHTFGDPEALEYWRAQLEPGPKEVEAFKFLVHFLGDMQQPLHLTGRNVGGNTINVTFEGQPYRFHAAWDKAIPNKLMSLVPKNYSTPLPDHPSRSIPPSSIIEAALNGSAYRAFVRRILWEGVNNRWSSEARSWLNCPAGLSDVWNELIEVAVDVFTAFVDRRPIPPRREKIWNRPVEVAKGVFSAFFDPPPALKGKLDIQPDGPLVCPYAWTKPTHDYACEFVWPKEFVSNDPSELPLLELATPEYFGVLRDGMAVEKLLAQGGLRLAGILNLLFGVIDAD